MKLSYTNGNGEVVETIVKSSDEAHNIININHTKGVEMSNIKIELDSREQFMNVFSYKQVQKKSYKEQIISSLKWINVNLGETEQNTFAHAIKQYVSNAIDYIEKVEEIKL